MESCKIQHVSKFTAASHRAVLPEIERRLACMESNQIMCYLVWTKMTYLSIFAFSTETTAISCQFPWAPMTLVLSTFDVRNAHLRTSEKILHRPRVML